MVAGITTNVAGDTIYRRLQELVSSGNRNTNANSVNDRSADRF